MFDAREELKRWKEELVKRQHELLCKKEKYGRFLSCDEHRDIDDCIAAFTFRICIVDRELQFSEGDRGVNSDDNG